MKDCENLSQCCQAWQDAMASGSDNEGYGELLIQTDNGRWEIGFGLPPINLCPWCGASKYPVATGETLIRDFNKMLEDNPQIKKFVEQHPGSSS